MTDSTSAGSSKERALQSIIKGLRDAGESNTSSRGRLYWLAADELEQMRDALERIIHHAPGSWQADIARKVIGNKPIENETSADIRDELRELREIANVSTPQLCIAIREVVQRIEDAAHPANAPPYRPTFGDSASPEWRQANERTKHHVSGCDCRDCQTVRGTSKSTHEQCTCGESMAKWGDDLCRCKMFDEVRPALKANATRCPHWLSGEHKFEEKLGTMCKCGAMSEEVQHG